MWTKYSKLIAVVVVAALMALLIALPAFAGGYSGGGFRSSSFSSSRSFSSSSYRSFSSARSFSSPRSFSSRGYSSPSRAYAGPSRSYYSTPRSSGISRTPSTSYYSRGSEGRYRASAAPSYVHSNIGWYALIAYMAYNAGSNSQMALDNPPPTSKDMCTLSMTDMQNIISEDDVYTKEEMQALAHWRIVCNHPRKV